MKFESVISETKAKREQVWLAYDYNGDQLQLEAKWLDDSIRRLPADYVFLIRVVSICDGCPILLTEAFDSIRHVYLRVITICMLSIITHEMLPPLHTQPVCEHARWRAQMTSESVEFTHDFSIPFFKSRWTCTVVLWLILHPTMMCWTGLEIYGKRKYAVKIVWIYHCRSV